jgi:RNA polymerase II subunit A small phosphatase-like protein
VDSIKKLLILDIDETLIYATEASLPRQADFLVGQYHIYKRPFLNVFLKTVAYDIEWLEYYNRKNLKKVKRKGYRLESIIAVDDTPQKWERSYGNLVRVNPFEGRRRMMN